MNTTMMTPRHWILLILTLLFMNIVCWGCVLLIYGVGI